jgi:3-hydroxyisobutyrate dehydrogenase
MSKPRIAILGLGIMGGGMARRLLSSGFHVVVFNRSREKSLSLAKAGALVADSPKDAAARADIVFSMVSDDNASRAVWLGENGAFMGVSAGSILIESSTLSVGWVKELSALAHQHGCEFPDAPVTGTKSHAASGELFFMVGGPASALEKVRSVLSVLGREVLHLGPVGSAALIKLINNFVCGVEAASFAEALALADKSGLDREKCLAVLENSALASPLIKRIISSIKTDDYTPNFPLKLMAKDLGYAISEAKNAEASLKTAAPALDVFQHAAAEGLGDLDFSAVVKSFGQS